MADFAPKEKAARFISKQLLALDDIVRETKSGQTSIENAFEQLRRWKRFTLDLLAEYVSKSEAADLERKRPGAFVLGQPTRNLLSEARMYRAFLEALAEEIEKNPDKVLAKPAPDALIPAVAIPTPTASRTVFIIHGKDELNLLRLQKLLRECWNLSALIMGEKAGKGRTLIEKFEGEAQSATFAFALLTPDDIVQGPSGEYAQARPNVVFELGWFCGRLGRERVCILLRKGTKLHSDLDGISRIEFDSNVEEKALEIERELRAADLT